MSELIEQRAPATSTAIADESIPRRTAQDAALAAQRKHARHDIAVTRMGDQFIPFVVETYGGRDPCCKRLVDKLATVVLPHMRREFVFQFWSAVSCELARGRAKAVMSAYAAYVAG
jgi:hypothetical protein